MKVYMYGNFVSGTEQSNVYAVAEKHCVEVFLTDASNKIYSAYKREGFEEYSAISNAARDFWTNYQLGLKWCSNKNSAPAPVKGLGTVKRYTITKGKKSWVIDKYDGVFAGGEFIVEKTDTKDTGFLSRVEPFEVAKVDYIHLTSYTQVKDAINTIVKDGVCSDLKVTENREENIPVRTLAEIGLMKDTTWLDNKKYYIVNDEEQAEQIFQYLDNYKGLIAYDTETTGLCINMFGEIGSPRKELIEKENKSIREEGGVEYKVDRLVGIIFCVEENVSYYFPCFNRKFKNLYEDRESAVTKRVMNNILAKYTVGELRNSTKYIANYIRNTPMSEWTHDVIMMERVRNILENGNLATHHGSFEYKVGLMYGIDTNLREDSMLLHQLLFKFENISSSNDRGESSTLKHLTKTRLGVDQLDLKDFFVEYTEDSTGFSRSNSKGKKKKSKIDFSYMDYDGSKAYAPADGDFTLALVKLFRKKMRDEGLMEQEYIYNVEILTSCAIGYMEFSGHRLDETEIEATKISTQTHMLLLEKKIRDTLPANTADELEAFAELERLDVIKKSKESVYRKDKKNKEAFADYQKALHKVEEQNQTVLDLLNSSPNQLNLSSPAQVAELFYVRLGIPPVDEDEKKSVKENAIKPLSKMRNENQELLYPVVKLYMDWKNDSTLLTKFFGKLTEFAYPGGFIFSGFGQITTATGRMSCIAEGTKISMPGEFRNIEDVKVGDMVYCYDSLGNLQLSKVLNVLDNGIKDCVEVSWKSTGNSNTGSVICTPEHTLRLTNGKWIQAEKLKYGDRVSHLRITEEERPRLYGIHKFCQREQDFLKEKYFKCYDTVNHVVHHKDETSTNNKLPNLELMSKREHSRYHGRKLADEGRLSTIFNTVPHKILRGKEHPCFIEVTQDSLEKLVHEAKGIISHIDMDFNTFKKKSEELGFDYAKVASQYRTYYNNVGDDEFIQAYNECKGVPYAIHKRLGIGRTKVNNTLKRLKLIKKPLDYTKDEFIKIFYECEGKPISIANKLGLGVYRVKTIINDLNLCYNHMITKVTEAGKHHVYDLVIEEHHNFISNELCTHNCSRPNAQQYPHAVTKMVIPRENCVFVDADYSQIEYRTLTAMAKELSLMEEFRDPDMDYHTVMAALMYGVPYANVTGDMRGEAKTFNFGIPYGMGLKKLAFGLKGSESPEAVAYAKEKYDLYFSGQPNVKQFFDDVKEGARVYGYTKTKWGRRRYYCFVDKEGKIDQRKMSASLRQAGNACIQGTAADIFKMGVARNFLFIRENNLFGKYFITNMVHDEQLVEISCELNVKKILASLISAMELHLDDFPPLFVGAGIGESWDEAKGKMAEIHPILGRSYVQETIKDNDPIYAESPMSPEEVYAYFRGRNYKFREQKVIDYVQNTENHGQVLHPVIGSLLNLQFDYGVDEELDIKFPKNRVDIDFTKEEREEAVTAAPLEKLKRFMDAHNIDLDISLFKQAVAVIEEEEEDVAYSEDNEDSAIEDMFGDTSYLENTFKVLDESQEMYGCDIKEYIKSFGFVISHAEGILGINWEALNYGSQRELEKYLQVHSCTKNDMGAYRVVILTKSYKLMPEESAPEEQQLYVRGINLDSLTKHF